MRLCDEGHTAITYGILDCPLCDALALTKKSTENIIEMSEEIRDLQQQLENTRSLLEDTAWRKT